METNREITAIAVALSRADKVAVLTGSGISAESGIPTFRGEEGLWRNFRAQDLATPTAFARDPQLVWEWYDWRRGLMAPKDPNPGHRVLAAWENRFAKFDLITQNIDGLHQKAGANQVLELHGNIWKLRCTREETLFENRETPLPTIPPLCTDCGALLRPHVIWFGESLDMTVLQQAYKFSSDCDIMLVVGTSAVVHPAASLPLAAAETGAKIIEINPDATPLTPSCDFSIRGKAGDILPLIDTRLKSAWPDKKE